MSLSIGEIRARDRPRERLDRLGPSALTDAELVALVLRNGSRGAGAFELAHDLLAEQNLAGLSQLEPLELSRRTGIGVAKACSLAAAFELGRRAQQLEPGPSLQIRDPADVAALAQRELGSSRREQTVVIVLDKRLRVLAVERLTVGTQSRCVLDAVDVMQTVLRRGGVAFAIAHNHPSGDPTPSVEDRTTTKETMAAARSVGLRFLGHVVVANGRWTEVEI